ncbi:MAG: hypothetical protein IAE79_24200 [Anaerolinea sp.]|nr:hypothetical protein [Anaerolinea sp.]
MITLPITDYGLPITGASISDTGNHFYLLYFRRMIDIRPITTLADMRQAEAVQRAAWGMDDLEIVGVHVLHALQHNGSPLLGAFDGAKLVGFCLGVLGMLETPDVWGLPAAARLKMYSVMAGVLPTYQSQHVGYQLKLAQRAVALEMGIALITWTYDPLEARNAHFNIARLGAVCQHYHEHFHGDLGGINAGLSTDRFEAAWWVASARVAQRVDVAQRRHKEARRKDGDSGVDLSGALLVNPAVFNTDGLPAPPAANLPADARAVLVEIPADFQAVKQRDLALAQQWRRHTRQLFMQLFQDGFCVTDFVAQTDADGRRRAFYLLTL